MSTKQVLPKQITFSLSADQEIYFKIFDQPKQVRDICKLIINAGSISEAKLLDQMGEGGIKTRQSPEKILAYYLKSLVEQVGVTIETK